MDQALYDRFLAEYQGQRDGEEGSDACRFADLDGDEVDELVHRPQMDHRRRLPQLTQERNQSHETHHQHPRIHRRQRFDYGGRLQISAEIELDDLFSSIPEKEDIDVDIHELLAENRLIAHIWGIDDVQEQRPDLDDDQAWEVLQVAEKRIDITASPDTIDIAASSTRAGTAWQGRIDVRITDTDGQTMHARDMAALPRTCPT